MNETRSDVFVLFCFVDDDGIKLDGNNELYNIKSTYFACRT